MKMLRGGRMRAEDPRIASISVVTRGGPHCGGVIDDDDKLAAALIFEDLKRRGFFLSALSDNGPVYHLTAKSKALLDGPAVDTDR